MATRGVNKVILIGNLGQDPEVRYMPNGNAVTNFTLATSETWKDKNTGADQEKTEWHRCVAFRKPAEIIGEYMRKGSKIYVEGRLQTRQWEKEGQKHYTTEIVVDHFQFLDSRGGGTAPMGGPSEGRSSYGGGGDNGFSQPPSPPPGDFEDDIPF